MDVEEELAAMQRQVRGNIYKQVLQARRRIWQPTATERRDMLLYGDANPTRREWARMNKRMAYTIKELGDTFRSIPQLFGFTK